MKKLISIASLLPKKKELNAVDVAFRQVQGIVTQEKKQTVTFTGGEIVRIQS